MRAVAALLILLGASTPAGAGSSHYDQAFVDAFADACVPGRLTYEETRDTALAAGWLKVDRTDHPELAATMAKADEIIAADTDFDVEREGLVLARDVAGTRHHLSVTRLALVVEEGDAHQLVMVGCHLHNFDATAPIDPARLTALIEKPISQSVDQDGIVGHVWGPPCSMPRTGDTYLSFIAEGSAAAETTGFSGLSLNFSTSTPDPGEEVPETYC